MVFLAFSCKLFISSACTSTEETSLPMMMSIASLLVSDVTEMELRRA